MAPSTSNGRSFDPEGRAHGTADHDVDAARGSARPRTSGPDQVAGGADSLPRAAGNAAVARMLQRRVLQRRGGDSEQGEDHGEMVRQAVSGGGRALEPSVRKEMEADTGADLSGVKLHAGGMAAQAAAAVQSEAFTTGDNIVMGASMPSPSSPEGKHTLRHEVQHVLQQRAGAVSATDTGTGVAVSDPSDSFEQAAEGAAAAFSQRSQSVDDHEGHDH